MEKNISYLCRDQDKTPVLNMWSIIFIILGIGLTLLGHIIQIYYEGLLATEYIMVFEIIGIVTIGFGLIWYIIQPKQCIK